MNVIPGERIFSVSDCTVNLARIGRKVLTLMVTLVQGRSLTIETPLGVDCQIDVTDDQPAHAIKPTGNTDASLTTTVTNNPAASKHLVFLLQIQDHRHDENTNPGDSCWVKFHATHGASREPVTHAITEVGMDSIECEWLQTVGVDGME